MDSHDVALQCDTAEGLPHVMAERVVAAGPDQPDHKCDRCDVCRKGSGEAVESQVRAQRAGRDKDLGRGFGGRHRCRPYAQNIRCFLHDKAPRDGNGIIDLPVNHRIPWRSTLGGTRQPLWSNILYRIAMSRSRRRRPFLRPAPSGLLSFGSATLRSPFLLPAPIRLIG
jgi:hypothetical protein